MGLGTINISSDIIHPLATDKYTLKLEEFLLSKKGYDNETENALEEFIAWGFGENLKEHLLEIKDDIPYINDVFDYQLESSKDEKEFFNYFLELKNEFLIFIDYKKLKDKNSTE